MEPADDADLTAFDDADAGFTAGDAPFAKLASFTADDDDEEEEPAKAPDAALSASVALEPPAPKLLVSVALEPPPAPVVVSTEDLAAMAPTPVAAPPAPPSPATAPASPVVQQPTPPSALQPQQDPARADALQAARQAEIRRRRLFGAELVSEHSRYTALDRLLGRGAVECGALRLLAARAVEAETARAASCGAFAQFPADARQELGAEPAASVSAQDERTTYGVARLLAAGVAGEADAHEHHAQRLRSECLGPLVELERRLRAVHRNLRLKGGTALSRAREAARGVERLYDAVVASGQTGDVWLATVQYTAGSALLARTWADARAQVDALFATCAATETERRSLERRCLRAFLEARRECHAAAPRALAAPDLAAAEAAQASRDVAAEVETSIAAEAARVADQNRRRRPAPARAPMPDPVEPVEPLSSLLVRCSVVGERKTNMRRWRPALVVATADRRVHVYEGFVAAPDLAPSAALAALLPASDDCLRGAAPPPRMPSNASEAQTAVQAFFAGAPAPLAPSTTLDLQATRAVAVDATTLELLEAAPATGAAAIFSSTVERKVQLRFATADAAQELLNCFRAR